MTANTGFSDLDICSDVEAGRFPTERFEAWWRAWERCQERGLIALAGCRLTDKGRAFLAAQTIAEPSE